MTAPHLVEAGTGPVLLCLHGISSSSSSFSAQLRGLSGSLRVVAWDAPGYGGSAELEGEATMEAFAGAAAGVIERLGAPAHLLGASWGGVVAATVALRRPELLRSLVLIGASRGSGRDASAAAAMRRRADDLDESGVETFAKARAPKLLSPGASPELVAAVAATISSSLHPSGFRKAAAAMCGTDLTADLGRIATPTLVLCGALDEVTGPAEADRLASAIPGAVQVKVKDAGHLVHQEAPASVNAWVKAFIDIVDGTTRDPRPTEAA